MCLMTNIVVYFLPVIEVGVQVQIKVMILNIDF